MSKKFLFLISFVLVLILANGASAQDANLICWWSDAGDTNLWSDANNWYTGDWNDIDDTWVKSAANSVPAADDIALIGQGADWFPYPNDLNDIGPIGNCTLNSDAVCYQLYIGADPCDPCQPSHLEMIGGSLTIRMTPDDWLGISIAWPTNGTGSMTIHDGIVDINHIVVPMEPQEGGLFNVGGYDGGVGTLTMLGGEVSCFHFDCPDSWVGEEDMEAHFNLYGGTLYTTGDEEWMEFWLGMEGLSPNSTMDITEGQVIMVSPDEEQLDYIMDWIEEGKITAYVDEPSKRAEVCADYGITNPGKTTLQAIGTKPDQAWNPQPRPGRIVDWRPLTLSWTPGDGAVSHVVWLSSDRDAVVNSTAPNTPTGANSIAAGTLEFSSNYSWRVDEVNVSGTTTGLVWDFRAPGYIAIENFDSYADHTAIKAVWKDFWTGTIAKNGAEVFVEKEPEFVRDGQSMKFYYRNFLKDKGKFVGSVAQADVANLGTGNSDWTVSGAKALVLYFFGDPLNGFDTTGLDQDQMYIELGSGAVDLIVEYDGDMNDVKEAWWHDWNIELQDISDGGINLSNVERFYIGFGGYAATGQSDPGAGMEYFVGDTVWFDDIRLYPTRCVARHGPIGDITEDCITDYQDIDIMSRDWLDSDALISPTEPNNRLLLAFYQFEEGAGPTVANDGSLGSAANGTLSAAPNTPTWVTDMTDPNAPRKCMEFDGINDYVLVPDFNSIAEGGLITNHFTITAWIKRDGDQSWWTGLVFCTDNTPGDWEASVSIAGLSLGDEADWEPLPFSLNQVVYHWDSMPDGTEVGWMFRSGLLVPDNEWTFAAVVVEPLWATCYKSDGTTLESAVRFDEHTKTSLLEPFYIGLDPRGQWGPEFPEWPEGHFRAFKGRMDDVRIYNYALSKGEISWLAGVTDKVYDPLVSLANLLPKDPCDSEDPNLGSGAFDPNNIDIVDFRDYRLMANDWLVGPILWP